MSRRPWRPLSAEERGLWAEVARSVRPLPGRILATPPRPAAAPPAAEPVGRTRPVDSAPPVPPAPPPLVGLDRRAARALARGQARPAATLDLHGLTQTDAHARLLGFLRRAQAGGHGLVLVITGRGGSGFGGERGVLRRSVPLWLGLPALRNLVIGFEEAGPRQGGAGALYVRLRRPRPSA